MKAVETATTNNKVDLRRLPFIHLALFLNDIYRFLGMMIRLVSDILAHLRNLCFT
jgi:hypothetical protein